MSAIYMQAVGQLELARPQKTVLLALAYMAGDDGICVNASKAEVGSVTGYHPKSVQRIYRKLELARLIKCVDNEQGGRAKSRTLKLLLHPYCSANELQS